MKMWEVALSNARIDQAPFFLPIYNTAWEEKDRFPQNHPTPLPIMVLWMICVYTNLHGMF